MNETAPEEASNAEDNGSQEQVDVDASDQAREAADAERAPSAEGDEQASGDEGGIEPDEIVDADDEPNADEHDEGSNPGGHPPEEAQDDDAEAEGDELDDLFLSPDEDSEGVIEVDYEGEEGTLEVRAEDVEEMRAELTTLRDRVDEAEDQRDEFKERWMRAAADLDNLRKRAKREKEELKKYGNDKLALELLPAIDNLERALAHAEEGEDASGIVDGVQMVYRQVLSALEKFGIVGFEAEGEKFNPEHHEAIQQVETSEHDTGMVVEQFQKGYFIHDRLLRPALVSVAKRVSGADNEQQSDADSDASEAGEQGDGGADADS